MAYLLVSVSFHGLIIRPDSTKMISCKFLLKKKRKLSFHTQTYMYAFYICRYKIHTNSTNQCRRVAFHKSLCKVQKSDLIFKTLTSSCVKTN